MKYILVSGLAAATAAMTVGCAHRHAAAADPARASARNERPQTTLPTRRTARVDRRTNVLEDRLAKSEAQLTLLTAQVDELTRSDTDGLAMSFSTCLLDHLKGTTSDLAAVSVKEACLRKAERPFEAVVTPANARYGLIHNAPGASSYGLYLTLNNATPYTITEIVLTLTDKESRREDSYVVRSFPPSFMDDAAASSTAPDPTVHMMLPPGPHSFTVETGDLALTDPDRFSDSYDWKVTSVKGFVD